MNWLHCGSWRDNLYLRVSKVTDSQLEKARNLAAETLYYCEYFSEYGSGLTWSCGDAMNENSGCIIRTDVTSYCVMVMQLTCHLYKWVQIWFSLFSGLCHDHESLPIILAFYTGYTIYLTLSSLSRVFKSEEVWLPSGFFKYTQINFIKKNCWPRDFLGK